MIKWLAITGAGLTCALSAGCPPASSEDAGVAQKQVGEACWNHDECVDGTLCAYAHCDESAATPCDSVADCPQPSERFTCHQEVCRCIRTCRPECDYPSYERCDTGQLCWRSSSGVGFCEEGECGEREDGSVVGTCETGSTCLDYNGPGSGLCQPLCTILEQTRACQQSPVPQGVFCCEPGESCEHYSALWGSDDDPDGELGFCFTSGSAAEGETCRFGGDDPIYCQAGLYCDGQACRRYCGLNSTEPLCTAGDECVELAGAEGLLVYGLCYPQ